LIKKVRFRRLGQTRFDFAKYDILLYNMEIVYRDHRLPWLHFTLSIRETVGILLT